MTGRTPHTDTGANGRGRRLAIFAAASLALHVVLLGVAQIAGLRNAPPAPEPVPVQIVELAEPPAPPQVEETPEPPEPPRETPPEPPEPEETPPPEPEPEAPEPPRAEAPAPAEPAQPAQPEEDEDETRSAEAAPETPSVVIPGLNFGGGFDSPLALFGHLLECSAIDKRYEEFCADVGPVYLAENDPERLAPEVERIFRETIDARNRLDDATIPNVGACEDPPAGGNLTAGTCVQGNEPRIRDFLN